MKPLTTLRSISNCLSFADSHSSLGSSALPVSAAFGILPHGEFHSLSSSPPPIGLRIVGKGVASLCSVPTVKVPKASGLDEGEGSGEEVEGGVGECDTSSSSPTDGEGGCMSSLDAGCEEGDEWDWGPTVGSPTVSFSFGSSGGREFPRGISAYGFSSDQSCVVW
jgi:hypothetical protein